MINQIKYPGNIIELQENSKKKPIYIHKQILTNHFILLVLAIFLFCFCLGTLSIQTIVSQISKSNFDNLHHINNQTDTFFKNLEESLDYIVFNEELRSSLVFSNQFDNIDNINLNFNIKNYISYFLGLDNNYDLSLFNLNQLLWISSQPLSNNSFDIKSENWYKEFITNQYTETIISSSHQRYYPDDKPIISYITSIKNYTEEKIIGFLMLDINHETIKDLYTNKISPTYPIIVLDENDNLIFSSDSLSPEIIDKVSEKSKYFVKEKKMKIGNETYLVSKQSTTLTKWKIISLISISKQLRPFTKLTLILIPIIILIILLDSFISLNTSKKIIKPLNDLIDAMQNTQQGFFKQKELPETNIYEIYELSNAFENMMNEINYLVDTNQKINLLKNESQLIALQQQIDPHFLFNTLELISGHAILENAISTSEMTQKLGNLFRYNLRAPDMVTIEKEINYIKDYLYLQNIRFNNTLNFIIDIDDEILNYEMPKLSLQPLIENSIKHGFSDLPFEDNSILIKGQLLENNIKIEIIDNGIGFTKKKLAEINTSMLNDINNFQYFINRKKHIGIRNVNARICLYYKRNIGLKIESIPNKQTKVTIIFSTTCLK